MQLSFDIDGSLLEARPGALKATGPALMAAWLAFGSTV
jgi:hypothetical protein